MVVVGGGVVGATAAYRSAQRGATTLLLDAWRDGRATDAGAGIVSPETEIRDGSPNQVLAEAAVAFNGQFVAELRDAGAPATGYVNCGKLIVARDGREAEWLGAYLGMLLDPKRPGSVPDGIAEISVAEARTRFPLLGPATRAAWSRDAGRLDGRMFTASVTAAAAARGCDVRRGAVERLVVDRGAVRAVLVDGVEIDAPRVVLAAGAWTAALLAGHGVDLELQPQRGQIVHLAVDEATDAWPVVSPLAEHYLLAFPGRVVIGATREDGTGFDARATAAGVRRVIDDGLSIAPALADATLVEVRVGLRPVARRGHPFIGPVPGVAGCFVATGHGPSGLTHGPWSGAQVADAALGLPHADLTAFAC
jgi:D-amino-acid dehydrogenase